jgi:hypothetical protein
MAPLRRIVSKGCAEQRGHEVCCVMGHAYLMLLRPRVRLCGGAEITALAQNKIINIQDFVKMDNAARRYVTCLTEGCSGLLRYASTWVMC